MKKTILITLFGISALILGSCTKSQPEEIDNTEEVVSVSLHPSELTMVPGETSQLELTVLPESIMESVTPVYSSDDESVATVSQSGLVTAVAEGSAVITVTVQNKTASTHVSVDIGSEPEEEGSMSFTINLSEYDNTYFMPFTRDGVTGDYNLTIDWGDGTVYDVPAGTELSKDICHEYTEKTEYTVTVTSSNGQIPDFRPGRYRNDNDNNRKFVSMNTPLLRMNVTDANNMFGYTGLRSIPEDLFVNNPQIVDFTECFQSSSLETVPGKLFINNPAAVTMSGCFAFCTSLTEIPVELFAGNPEITSFATCFCYCDKLASVPEDLFVNNTKAVDFSYVFCFCSGITEIPENLFARNLEIETFGDCFSYCTSITHIPENLFVNNVKAKIFDGVFSGCSGLLAIPEDLFANNTKAESFFLTFQYCSSLTEIPENLFANNKSNKSFYGTFDSCSGLTSVPEKLFANNPEVTIFDDCFLYTGLTSLPAGLFANNPAVTDMMQCFSGTYITSIPSGFFDNNPELRNLTNCFAYCSYLTEIPDGLFENNTKLTDVPNLFEYCDLREVPEYLFANCPDILNFSYCFSGNYNLVLNPNIFCDEASEKDGRFAGKAMAFAYCFSDCGFALSPDEGGTAPALWTYPMDPLSQTAGCFANVTNVTNADEIPSNWK